MSIRNIQCITASGDGVDPALLITLDCRPTVQYLVGAPEGFSRLALEQGVRPGLGLRAAFCHNVCAQQGMGSLIMRLRSDGHGYVHVVGPQGSSAHLGSLSEFISWQFPTVLSTELTGGTSEEAYEDEWLNVWSCRQGDEMLPAWLREELACTSDDSTSSGASNSSASSSSSPDTASTSSTEPSSPPGSSGRVPKAASASPAALASARRPSRSRGGTAVLSNHQTEAGDSVTVGGHAYRRPGRREEPQFRVGLFVRQTGQDALWSAGAVRDPELLCASIRASNRWPVPPPPPFPPPFSPQRPPGVLLYVLFLRASRQVLLAAHAASVEECSALGQLPVLRALNRARFEVVLAALSVSGSLLDSEALRGLRQSLPRVPVVLLPRGAEGGSSEPRLGHRQSLKACARLHACCPPLFQIPHGLSSAGQLSPAEGAPSQPAELLGASSAPIWTTTVLVPAPGAEPGWTLRPMHEEAPQALVCRVLEECRAGMEETSGVGERLLQRLPPLVQQACVGRWHPDDASPSWAPRSSSSSPPALQSSSNRRAALRLREELLSRKKAKRANNPSMPSPPSPSIPPPLPLDPCFSDPDIDAETSLGAGGARLLFLGTGSAEPSSHRGPSAILVQTSDPTASLLLDCGEGTAGALARWLGPSGARAAALALSLVWISHRHADHMSGLPGLLRLRGAEARPLVVVGPLSLWRWLRGSASARGVRFVSASAFAGDAARKGGGAATLWRASSCSAAPSPPSLLPHAPFLLHAEPMQHCPDAWACVVRHHGSGWALAYSGDGMPSQRLAEASRGCSLLIHEATFEDDRAGDAVKKRHSTVSQALGVGEEAGVEALVLTHFSQRYPRFPRGVLEEGRVAGDLSTLPFSSQSRRCVGVAFDGMMLPLAALPFLPDLMRAVQAAVPGEGLPEAQEAVEEHAS